MRLSWAQTIYHISIYFCSCKHKSFWGVTWQQNSLFFLLRKLSLHRFLLWHNLKTNVLKVCPILRTIKIKLTKDLHSYIVFEMILYLRVHIIFWMMMKSSPYVVAYIYIYIYWWRDRSTWWRLACCGDYVSAVAIMQWGVGFSVHGCCCYKLLFRSHSEGWKQPKFTGECTVD